MPLNFDEFQKVVETAQQADALKSELKRAMKKVASALDVLQFALAEMDTVLADGYIATPKTRKPRIPRLANEGSSEGTTPKKPGRPKKTAA